MKVKNWYAQSFEELINFPKPKIPTEIKEKLASKETKLPENRPNMAVKTTPLGLLRPSALSGHRYYSKIEDIDWPPEVYHFNERFTKLIESIKRRHDPVLSTVAQGIREYKHHKKSNVIDTDIQSFLDRFYMSRIGIRILIGQHVALNRAPSRPDYVGIICTKTNIHKTVQEAAENAALICEQHYGLFRAPEVQLYCPEDLIFTYIPTHLNHMLFELLKNSLRAVVETFGNDTDTYPPIKVIVAEGQEDITIKISDEGAGIPRSSIPLVWTYMYTTAQPRQLDSDSNRSDFNAPMAGLGYGLPISRLYARYFGGDLKLLSLEGYGTDVYLHLNRISNSDEPLQ